MRTGPVCSVASRWPRLVAAVTCAAQLAVGCGGGQSGSSGETVEATYLRTGPAAITQSIAAGPGGLTFVLHYPTNLATDGYLNPVIAYGNGSGAVCTQGQLAEGVSRHLASWGFVVVCPDVMNTGLGNEILAAVRFMLAENSREGSVFKGQLDTASIGATGHSQGATGALNANRMAAGAIRSTVTLAFVDRALHGSDRPRLADVRGPVFLASGCSDPMTTEQELYFGEMPTAAAMACKVGADHVGMVRPSLGYTTAWFLYTLRGDAFARGAFVATEGQQPEVARNPGWINWRSKQLP